MSRPVARVVVVGRDLAAWMTALGLHRAFGRLGVTIQVVELPSHLSDVDVLPALPTLHGLHRLLGLDEGKLLEACSGLFALGQRFANWSAGRAPFLHAYDTQPVGMNNVELLQYWVKARAEGLKVEWDEFSLGAAMARHGRMIVNGDVDQNFSRPAHGYNLNATAYAQAMRQVAVRAGVEAIPAAQVAVAASGGRIASVTLPDGRQLEADLFIDASGTEAALIGGLPGAEFDSWKRWLPCDRILAASAQRLDPAPAYSQTAAFRSGWIGLYPLRDRTGVIVTFDSGQMSDRDVVQTIGPITGMGLQGQPVAAPFQAGMRRPWIGNCVAVGEAAVALEPLDAAPLHLIQTGLSLLISLFPVDAETMPEESAYVAAMTRHAVNLRDFQIAHYRLNQRYDEPLWDRARAAEPPETLAYKLQLFEAQGRVPLYDDETFQASNWTASLIGHGLIPRDHDPRVDMVPDQEQMMQMQRMLGFIAEEVKRMPAMADMLAPPGSSGAPSRASFI